MEAREQKIDRESVLRFRLALASFAGVLLLLGSLWFAYRYAPQRVETFSPNRAYCLVIDPGHGGIDGGAIAYNGVKESDLNLSIALRLQDLASFFGVRTCMTRQDDSAKSNYSTYSEHEDLVCRAELVESVGNAVLISIHQNAYPTSQPRGAQVLYGADTESRILGELTHGNLIRALQPENRRVAVPASRELYLTSHVSCPVILVECGFMTNLSDLQQLSDPQYQRAFAAVLLGSFLQFAAASI